MVCIKIKNIGIRYYYMLIYSNGLFKLYNLFMTKYTNALFITHREISEDFKQVDMAMINQCDDDRVFFNLGECSGTLEGALKLKEISYIHAEGYPAAEMKNGPIALIDEEMPAVFVATHD